MVTNQPPFRPINRFFIVECGIYVSLIGYGIWGAAVGERLPLTLALHLGFGLTAFGLLIYIASRRMAYGRFLLTPPLVLAATLFIWHFAFVGVYIAGAASPHRIPAYFGLAPSSNQRAVAICSVGMIAFLFGLAVGERKNRLGVITQREILPSWIGGGMIVVGCCLNWVFYAIGGHEAVGDYSGIFSSPHPLRFLFNFGTMLVLGSLGPAVVLSYRNREAGLWSLLALIASVPGALMGSRWVVFTALLLLASGWSVRGARVSWWLYLSASLVLLVVSVAVKEFRSARSGASIGDFLQHDFLRRHTNPAVEFLEETGVALRSCLATIELRDYHGVKLNGASFLDAIRSTVPGGDASLRDQSPTILVAETYFNEMHVESSFAIGYSVIAEWYLNFGITGVLLGQILIGLVIACCWHNAVRLRGVWIAMAFCCAAFMMFGFRNDALTWWRTLTRALLCWGFVYGVLHVLRPRLFGHIVTRARQVPDRS